jgi:hypothetical protein
MPIASRGRLIWLVSPAFFVDLSLAFGAIYSAWDAPCRARLKML